MCVWFRELKSEYDKQLYLGTDFLRHENNINFY